MTRAADPTPGQWAELLERRRAAAAARRIQAASRAQRIPLSPGQERLWFLARLAPDSTVFSLPFELRIRGPLDLQALRWALTRVVARHEVLRTTYPDERGIPYQHIAPAPQQWPVAVEDLSAWPAHEALPEARRRAAAVAAVPFDLAAGPVLRAAVFTLSRDDHLVLVAVHHIAMDRHSLGILLSEVGVLYRARLDGAADPLPELPIQYADFAVWQRRQLREGALAAGLEKWRSRLAGVPVLDLPADYRRPATLSGRGAIATAMLGPAAHKQVADVARRLNTSLLPVLLAALSVVLARHGRTDDMAIGTIVDGRTRTETRSLIGFFANTVVLRISHAGATSLREVIGRAHEAVGVALAGQDVPFSSVVDAVTTSRAANRHPVFGVTLIVQPPASQRVALGEATAEVVPLATGTARFDLSVSATPMPDGGLGLGAEYSTDLFGPDRVERLLGQLVTMLASLPGNLEADPAQVEIMPAPERAAIARFTAGPASEPPVLILDRLDRSCTRLPAAPAVIAADATLSYAGLRDRVSQLAWALRAAGITRGARVGVCLQRTSRLVVALLAVLRCGAAYVPLDPAYPAGRLRLVLHDAGVALAICEESTEAVLPDGTKLFRIDDTGEIAAYPVTSPVVAVDPRQLAYILHTSGSTGEPKGVMIEHRQLANLLSWADSTFPAGTVLASTSVCFDLSVFELFGPLSRGGTTVIVPDIIAAMAMGQLPAPVSLVNTVPSVLATLLRDHPLPPGVQAVTLAGEPLPAELVRSLREDHAVTDVRNLYGPTETTTYSTATGPLAAAGGVPVGRPITGTRCHVLDEHLRPVPIGIPGELYLGGAGVTRGYLGKPGLTAERYLPDADAGDGSRLYRTGDLARWWPNGELEHLGRTDAQVKVNGFRIEPGEIEAELARHPAVQAVAVAMTTDERAGPSLVAYFVPRPGFPVPGVAELRAAAAGRLPRHMLPARSVVVTELPSTPTGKLDRAALTRITAAPARGRPGPASRMARLWAEVLGVPEVADEDDFFAIGGTSLLVPRLLAAVREAFGTDLPLRVLFECPTPALLAAYLSERAIPDDRSGAAPAAADPVP